MITCILYNCKVDEIVTIVRELRESGLQQGTDFNFKWIPPHYEWNGDNDQPSAAEFYFYTEELATMFELKYRQ